ncbi:MAG: asparagine--tRNA ligase [Treponema sp.]|nr:asparagine--tRNA ligase [Treponema sp.]MCL2252176.1 asparagine--tRNA ligase [Treponema sp.]
MLPKLIKHILKESPISQEIEISGWVRTKRDMKNLVFVEVNDGSCFASIQCTFDRGAGLDAQVEEAIASLSTGASVKIKGALVPSPASGQAVEVAAVSLAILGSAPAENTDNIQAYPLQKKRHSMEFLREIAHLRARTNTFGAVARLRSRMAFAIHRYFQERDFHYLHTPIITAGDCEGAGAMFQVTTLDPKIIAKDAAAGGVDYTKDFFGKQTFLTVSGQLEAETYATALSRVYTFGPTFRAENSNTVRHLAEFWMVEPEVAFAQLEDDMALAEDFIKYILNCALEECADELAFFDAHVEKGIIENLKQVVNAKFAHITYTEAVKELEKAVSAKKGLFEFEPKWGSDLQSEHEKYLTEKVAGGPVIVTDYPKEIKAFYMKLNDDNKTVRAMDVLVPRLGEIIGGSQREDDFNKLCKRIKEMGMKTEDYSWYLDLRRYGSVPHAGFGLGFERLIQYVSGMANIRDVIPFPRAVGQAEF